MSARGSAAITATAPAAVEAGDAVRKVVDGAADARILKDRPNTAAGSRSVAGSPTTMVQPCGAARVFSTAMGLGQALGVDEEAVPAIRRDAGGHAHGLGRGRRLVEERGLAMSRPVRSQTRVWKFRRA